MSRNTEARGEAGRSGRRGPPRIAADPELALLEESAERVGRRSWSPSSTAETRLPARQEEGGDLGRGAVARGRNPGVREEEGGPPATNAAARRQEGREAGAVERARAASM